MVFILLLSIDESANLGLKPRKLGFLSRMCRNDESSYSAPARDARNHFLGRREYNEQV
jgi:hypothetical protein